MIPNGLDLDRFRPRERAAVRATLGLPTGRRVLLSGGAGIGREPHKDLPLLAAALHRLPAATRGALDVVIFGTAAGDRLPEAAFPLRDLGHVAEARRCALGERARGIAWALAGEARRCALGERARAVYEARFGLERVARAYADLYREVMARAGAA